VDSRFEELDSQDEQAAAAADDGDCMFDGYHDYDEYEQLQP
jgi:hypothetical protein